jgi:hypothetical protein
MNANLNCSVQPVRRRRSPAGEPRVCQSTPYQRYLNRNHHRTNQVLAADRAGQLSVAVEGDLQTPVGAVQMPDGGYFVSNINGGVAWRGVCRGRRSCTHGF